MSTNVYIGSNPIYKQYIGSSYSHTNVKSYDVNTLDFITATGISNAGVVNSIDVLVKSLKSNGLWDYMDAIYPLVADNTASLDTQFKYNLKDTSSLTLTFVNGVNGDLNGYKSNSSTSQYVNTGYIPTTYRNADNKQIHVSVYTTDLYNTISPAGNAIDWGGINPDGYSYISTGRTFNDPNTTKVVALREGVIDDTISVAEAGYSICEYDGGVGVYYYLNNSNIITKASQSTGDISPVVCYFGAWNNNGSPQYITNKKYQFLSVGNFIPSGSISTLNTIVQTFQESIDSALGTSRAI